MTKSGIYKCTNLVNKKYYIGSACNMFFRWKTHINALNRNKHHSYLFQIDWNKYGKDSFKFEILEIVENLTLLIPREQYYLDLYKSYEKDIGYNICPKAGNSLGVICSENKKKLLSQKLRGRKLPIEVCLNISKGHLGKVKGPHSEETKQKIRESLLGKPPKTIYIRTPEIREKISKTLYEKTPRESRQCLNCSKLFLVRCKVSKKCCSRACAQLYRSHELTSKHFLSKEGHVNGNV